MQPNPQGDNHPPRPKPVTVDQKLDDIFRRLGHVERHLIDLKGNPPPPGEFRYQPEPYNF
jgi:hypothetical protein